MRICGRCGATEETTRIINSKGQLLCGKCYQRRHHATYPLPPKGEIQYTEDGKPICHICGEAHHKIMGHVWQVHGMSALEYKKEYGLDLHTGIMSEQSTKLARKRALEHIDINLENLVVKGAKTRFKAGGKGRTLDKISLQTYRRLQHSKFIKRKGE